MVFLRQVIPLVLAAPAWLLAGDADTVNERIPVRKQDMEVQWQVNCEQTWQDLSSALELRPGTADCLIGAKLARDLQLCAFIYQPPGSKGSATCPDYGRAHLHAQKQDCAALRTLVRSERDC